MITSPEKTVSLKDTDRAKIDLVQARLGILQAEVLEATESLADLQKATVTAVKERNYQEKLLGEVSEKVSSLLNEKVALEVILENQRKAVEVLTVENEVMIGEQVKREQELNERESGVIAVEEQFLKESETVRVGLEKLEVAKKEVESVQSAFLEIAKLITWK